MAALAEISRRLQITRHPLVPGGTVRSPVLVEAVDGIYCISTDR